jgi:hypothetical protein
MKRVGNWYSVGEYNVLIQKEENSIYCEPSSILVFDEDFNQVNTSEVYEWIEKLMRKVDWKYDVVDEE